MSYFTQLELKQMLRGRTAETPLFEPVALPGHVQYTKILVLHQEPKMKMLLKMVEEEAFNLVIWAKPTGPARVMKSKTNIMHLGKRDFHASFQVLARAPNDMAP